MTTDQTQIPPLYTWDEDAYGNEHYLERRANGTVYRAVVIHATESMPPDGDCYPTVLTTDRRHAYVALSGYDDDLLDAFQFFYATYGESDALAVFERYVRIFHGGAVERYSSTIDRGGSEYVSVVSRDTWTQVWGNGADVPVDASNPDFEAYIDGEVYGIRVDVAAQFDDDGEPVAWEDNDFGGEWGHYGAEWAAEAAVAEMTSVIADDATRMLPLVFAGEEATA